MSALSLKEKFIKLIATGFYSSALPPWPGTSGTIPAWLIAWLLIKGDLAILATVTLVTIAVSVWSTGAAEKIMGHDSRFMVMDEWVGMFIALLFVPYNITNYLIAFFAFRLLDAIKPYPVYNDSLRELAKKYDLPLIDLDRWSRKALKPRANFFIDSVHLTEQGQT